MKITEHLKTHGITTTYLANNQREEKIMYGFIEKDSDLKIEDAVYDEVLNAGLGWMHELKKGQTFRILDIEGNQPLIRHL